MTTPAVALLRSFLPQAEITYLVEEPFRRLVEGHPRLDRVLAVPAKQSRREFAGLLRRIRKERYDALLDFHGGPRASWITAFSGARHKVGYAIAGKSFLYDLRVPRRPEQGFLHSVQTHAALVRSLGFEFSDESIPPLELPPVLLGVFKPFIQGNIGAPSPRERSPVLLGASEPFIQGDIGTFPAGERLMFPSRTPEAFLERDLGTPAPG